MAGAKTGTPRRVCKTAKKKASGSWPNTFIAALAETSNVTASAKRANISLGHVYKLRRSQPDFRRRWQEALCEGYAHLEMEVLRRLRNGDNASADGGKFDFANALRVLAAHGGTVKREAARQEAVDEEAVLASITAKIAVLRCSREETQPAAPAEADEARDAGAR